MVSKEGVNSEDWQALSQVSIRHVTLRHKGLVSTCLMILVQKYWILKTAA